MGLSTIQSLNIQNIYLDGVSRHASSAAGLPRNALLQRISAAQALTPGLEVVIAVKIGGTTYIVQQKISGIRLADILTDLDNETTSLYAHGPSCVSSLRLFDGATFED